MHVFGQMNKCNSNTSLLFTITGVKKLTLRLSNDRHKHITLAIKKYKVDIFQASHVESNAY